MRLFIYIIVLGMESLKIMVRFVNVLELGQGKSYTVTVIVMNYLKSSWFRLPGYIPIN